MAARRPLAMIPAAPTKTAGLPRSGRSTPSRSVAWRCRVRVGCACADLLFPCCALQKEVQLLRSEAAILREENKGLSSQCHALEQRVAEAEKVRGVGEHLRLCGARAMGHAARATNGSLYFRKRSLSGLTWTQPAVWWKRRSRPRSDGQCGVVILLRGAIVLFCLTWMDRSFVAMCVEDGLIFFFSICRRAEALEALGIA